jgi:hypothetical protein
VRLVDTGTESGEHAVRVLLDDLRVFTTERDDDIVCRDITQAELTVLAVHHLDRVIDELYLDHDLGPNGTTTPFVDWLEDNAGDYVPHVARIIICSSNPAAVAKFVPSLRKAGYSASARNCDGYELVVKPRE